MITLLEMGIFDHVAPPLKNTCEDWLKIAKINIDNADLNF